MLRFFVLFLLIQATLFGLELTPPVQRWFVVPWTNALAQISTAIVTFFDPNVVAVGKVMRSTTNGFAVSIEAGCNGVEATIVLLYQGASDHPTSPGVVIGREQVRYQFQLIRGGEQLQGTILVEIHDAAGNIVFSGPGTIEATRIRPQSLP